MTGRRFRGFDFGLDGGRWWRWRRRLEVHGFLRWRQEPAVSQQGLDGQSDRMGLRIIERRPGGQRSRVDAPVFGVVEPQRVGAVDISEPNDGAGAVVGCQRLSMRLGRLGLQRLVARQSDHGETVRTESGDRGSLDARGNVHHDDSPLLCSCRNRDSHYEERRDHSPNEKSDRATPVTMHYRASITPARSSCAGPL